MSASAAILPSVSADRLLPPRAAFAARTTLELTRGLGYTAFNLDALTCHLTGILGERAAVRHVSGSSDEILGFLSDSGLDISERLLRYETEEQAIAFARQLIEEGQRLLWSYPPPDWFQNDSDHLVAPKLWIFLNDKRNLAQLTPRASAPERQVLSIAAAREHAFTRPSFVKAADGFATGWGYMVRHCPTANHFHEALDWFGQQEDVTELIVEDAIELEASWCMNITVCEDDVLFVSGVEQLFAAPGKQSGSLIDPLNPPPDAGIALVREIGRAASKLGFLGPAGIDIGRARDGRIYAFDPNFRFTSSYAQGLLHEAAARRSGLGTSLSVGGFTPLDIRSLLSVLRGPVEDGWLMTTRIIDGALLPAAEGRCHYTGFVLGRDRADAERRAAGLAALTSA